MCVDSRAAPDRGAPIPYLIKLFQKNYTPMTVITEIYNNLPHTPGLTTAWGFACLIHDAGILFDTGGDGAILLSNMERLGIDPREIRRLVLSHDHWDHTGGLSAFLEVSQEIEVFVHDTFSEETLDLIRTYTRPQIITGWTEITENIFSTGPMDGETAEQSLAVRTGDGFFIITGCAHPHISRIIAAVQRHGEVWGAMGGFHSVSDEDISALGQLWYFSASHCTDRSDLLKARYPETFAPGGAGRIHRI